MSERSAHCTQNIMDGRRTDECVHSAQFLFANHPIRKYSENNNK